jgi:hypothetical protein
MAMALREQGVLLKIVYLGHRDGTDMMVHKDSQICRIESLLGKKIAVPIYSRSRKDRLNHLESPIERSLRLTMLARTPYHAKRFHVSARFMMRSWLHTSATSSPRTPALAVYPSLDWDRGFG